MKNFDMVNQQPYASLYIVNEFKFYDVCKFFYRSSFLEQTPRSRLHFSKLPQTYFNHKSGWKVSILKGYKYGMWKFIKKCKPLPFDRLDHLLYQAYVTEIAHAYFLPNARFFLVSTAYYNFLVLFQKICFKLYTW